ncbi:S-adenosyl-L-methionine-dependent methyltransferase [Xylaria bambusicola]|uniref:S-adenosyl-L-methionine-dependent methyltransferase n=1 Tax=Xylaria bambusicola TaxID=326684 RepID=UPI0020079324|nr:S-adenosyl-L-methionine-dependent methyltransferase [Xylaria bambusicola]KAI0513027.1 S-adenosyl-L-methionine-dependent methyltransferase [Xylaria bambusicola]
MTEISPYPLNESTSNGVKKESDRLDFQHHFFDDVMNNELLPVHITNQLAQTPCPRVCDIATGTAIWLKELAKTLPASAELVGFDFDVSKFPMPEALPSNIRLSFGDAYEPFPEEFRNRFDVVHLRHFNLAMRKGQGVPLIRNLSSLLRPGGWLVWVEASAPLASAEPPSDGLFQAQKVYYNFLNSANLEADFPLGIASSMEQAELVNCETRSYHCASVLFGPKASDWLAREHEEFYATLGQILKGIFLKGGVDGMRTQQDLDGLLAKLQEDMSGTRKYHMPVIRNWGQKLL